MNILRSLLLVDLALVLRLSSCSMQIMLNTHTLHHGDEFDNIDWNYHRWIAPGEGDLRSPCPGMNTYAPLCFSVSSSKTFYSLANHGFISRDGRNITIPMVLKAADGTSRVSHRVIVIDYTWKSFITIRSTQS